MKRSLAVLAVVAAVVITTTTAVEPVRAATPASKPGADKPHSLPMFINVADLKREIGASMEHPVLIHFTDEQWSRAIENARVLKKRPAEAIGSLQFAPMLGYPGIVASPACFLKQKDCALSLCAPFDGPAQMLCCRCNPPSSPPPPPLPPCMLSLAAGETTCVAHGCARCMRYVVRPAINTQGQLVPGEYGCACINKTPK